MTLLETTARRHSLVILDTAPQGWCDPETGTCETMPPSEAVSAAEDIPTTDHKE